MNTRIYKQGTSRWEFWTVSSNTIIFDEDIISEEIEHGVNRELFITLKTYSLDSNFGIKTYPRVDQTATFKIETYDDEGYLTNVEESVHTESHYNIGVLSVQSKSYNSSDAVYTISLLKKQHEVA